MDRDRFATFALDVLREHAGAEIGVLPLRTVVAPPGLFPLRGTVTPLQLTAALPFDNELRIANVHGRALARARRRARRPRGFTSGGVTVHGDRVRINDRPLDDEATYRLATIDYVAEGGDGGIGSDDVGLGFPTARPRCATCCFAGSRGRAPATRSTRCPTPRGARAGPSAACSTSPWRRP